MKVFVKTPYFKQQNCAVCVLAGNHASLWFHSFSAYWLPSKCLVGCQHIDLWSWMPALFWYPYHRWVVQFLCILITQGGWRCETTNTVKIAVHSAMGCCTATTMALTSIKQEFHGVNFLKFKRKVSVKSGHYREGAEDDVNSLYWRRKNQKIY